MSTIRTRMQQRRARFRRWFAVAAASAMVGAGLLTSSAVADDETMVAPDEPMAGTTAFTDDAAMVDPPDRVARVSFYVGAVSLLPADATEWVDATVNRPLTNGDKLWVDSDGRAELQVGTATIHLDENTGLSFVALDDDVMQMNLSDGAVAVEVRALEPHERAEIDTPNATVILTQPGDYTISTEESGDRTIVKAHSGEAVVSGADQHEFVVAANEQGVFTGNQELTDESTQIGGRGPFETWAYQRNHAETGSVAARYVAPGVVGYQDLDANGTWAYEPQYGQVWQPTTIVYNDWAPYRYGRWTWIQPWGWTWIDDAPWGFAPFHYGRWLYLRQRWCWLPGPIHARPVYAPALVAWSGNPRGVFGPPMGFQNNVAWFPLGPREVFMPGYRSTWAHFRAVNASNTALADNAALSNAFYGRNARMDYRNRNALTAVDRNAFALSQRTGAHRVDIDSTDVAHWRPQASMPRIAPTRDAILGARPVGHDPAPRLDRRITIVHDDADDRRSAASGGPRFDRQNTNSAAPPRVWQGSSLAYSQNRPPRQPSGVEGFAPQGGGNVAPRSVDRPQNGQRPQFRYNGGFQNNGTFQNNGAFRDNGRVSTNRPPADAQTRNRTMPANPPDVSQRSNGSTQPHTPAIRPDAPRRPMPSEPPYHANNVVRQAPREAAPHEAAPAMPAPAVNVAPNSRTMGQGPRTSNLNGAGQHAHIGNARNYH